MIDIINQQFFHLHNDKISYIMSVMKNGQIGHVYYGKNIKNLTCDDCKKLAFRDDKSAGTIKYYKEDHDFTLTDQMQEYPVFGTTDFKMGAFDIKRGEVPVYPALSIVSSEVINGKEMEENVPQARNSKKAQTLKIHLEDALNKVRVTLSYTIYENESCIIRKNIITNISEDKLLLENAASAVINIEGGDYDLIHLSGAWLKERQVKRRTLLQGQTAIESLCGASSHFQNPFVAIAAKEAGLDHGKVYGCNLIYSGNFRVQADVNEWGMIRVTSGIHPYTFEWELDEGESFTTPEAVLCYSEEGIDGLSRAYADFISAHIINPKWLHKERPIVVNSWEAYTFDFDSKKLLTLARKGKEIGAECFVLDDGWFGKRNNDRSSLGDWFPNKEKFPEGIKDFADQIHDLGMKLGIWFEPEMINEDAILYKEHKDWVMIPPEGRYSYGRGQLVLDFANPEVVDHIFEMIDRIIQDTNLDYIKWDMNRNITEAYSPYLAKIGKPQGECFHRYILGVYSLYEKITQKYPEVMIEGCAAGGGRFDLGILYYSPQIWTSDDSDAVERLKIQFGTTLAYPVHTLSNHVSEIPNFQVGRKTPLNTRGDVAFFGNFGYEMDLVHSSKEELEAMKEQIREYKKIREMISDSNFYHISSPFDGNETIWALESKDQEMIMLGFYRTLASPNETPTQYICLPFVDENGTYTNLEDGAVYNGSVLKEKGLRKPAQFNGANAATAKLHGDYQSNIFYLKKNH